MFSSTTCNTIKFQFQKQKCISVKSFDSSFHRPILCPKCIIMYLQLTPFYLLSKSREEPCIQTHSTHMYIFFYSFSLFVKLLYKMLNSFTSVLSLPQQTGAKHCRPCAKPFVNPTLYFSPHKQNPRYLNSTTWGNSSSPIWSGHFPP